MKFKLSFCLLLIVACFSTGCLIRIDMDEIGKPTEMIVSILDSAGNPVANAPVALFRSLVDYETRIATRAVDTTDQDGQVKFTNLESADYWIYTFYEKGGKIFDNAGANYHLSDILVESSLTRVTIKTFYSRPVIPSRIAFQQVHIFKYGTENLYHGDTLPEPLIALFVKPVGKPKVYLDRTDSIINFNNTGFSPALLTFREARPLIISEYDLFELNMYQWIPDRDAIKAGYNFEVAPFNIQRYTKPDIPGNRRLAYPRRIRVVGLDNQRKSVIDVLVKWL